MHRLSLILLTMISTSGWCEMVLPEIDRGLPITIDAASSDFDYTTSQLIFRQMRIDQGDLGIQADIAETDKLDFTNGVWIFTGNVRVESTNVKLTCDTARLTFVDHQLTAAVLTGSPARFEQYIEESAKTNSGEARLIIYRLDTGSLQLKEDALFSDGANQISGELISYDLIARRLNAGSSDGAPIKIIIESPDKLKGKAVNP